MQKNVLAERAFSFHTLAAIYGLENWVKKLYKGLEVGVDNCTECGECEPRCPYQLPILSMLQKAQMRLQPQKFSP